MGLCVKCEMLALINPSQSRVRVSHEIPATHGCSGNIDVAHDRSVLRPMRKKHVSCRPSPRSSSQLAHPTLDASQELGEKGLDGVHEVVAQGLREHRAVPRVVPV